MLHLAFRKECVFYNEKPVLNETEHLEEVEEAQALHFCIWLAFMSLLLEYHCALQKAAKMEWYLPVI